MASLLSILKDVLKLNCMHVDSCEKDIVTASRYNEPFEQMRIIVHARPHKNKASRCPVCGRKCSGYDVKRPDKETEWRAPNLNGVPIIIRYTPRRIECPEHGILTENIPWADGNSHFTEDFNNEVAWLATRVPKSAVSEFIGINWRTVGNCVKAAWNRIEPDIAVRRRDLKRICVDETGSRKGYEYITVVYDMDRNRVVWIGEGVGRSVFEQFCRLLSRKERENITVVAGDGAKWIDSCTKEYFPNATRCVDFFHVVSWANEALDKVRSDTASKARREYDSLKEQYRREETEEAEAAKALFEEYSDALKELESMSGPGRPSRRKRELMNLVERYEQTALSNQGNAQRPKVGRPKKERFSPDHEETLEESYARAKGIKNAKHALGHRPEKCTEHQIEKLRLIENEYPDLYKAYQLKESLRLILHMKDYALATDELDSWIDKASACGLKPIEALAEKILRHRTNILNSVRLQANSSKSEATNTTIKTLIKVARGFRNMGNLFAFIYLVCSDLVIPLNNRYQPSPEKASELRAIANENRRRLEEARQEAYLTT